MVKININKARHFVLSELANKFISELENQLIGTPLKSII
jgi:hypothetical protein